MAENLPSKVAAADQRFSHLISEEALGECRVVDVGGAVAHATQLDCFKQNRTPPCRHPQYSGTSHYASIAVRARSHPSLKKGQESTHTSSFSRRRAPELCSSFAPSEKEDAGDPQDRAQRPSREGAGLPQEGSREDRVRAAPAVSRAKSEQNTHTSIQVQRKQSGLPCAMVLRLTSCSPWRPAFCHHHLQEACFSET